MGIVSRLPRGLVRGLEVLSPIHPFRLRYQRTLRRAVRAGPPYRPTHQGIVIDITTRCNLHCVDCNRSCGRGQVADGADMTLEQVERFIGESIEQKRRWGKIQLEGGEPTLHPQLSEIAEMLLGYIRAHSPGTHLTLISNGYGPDVNSVTARLPAAGVDVQGKEKISPEQAHHCAFNVAPCDMPQMAGIDFSAGCFLPTLHGLGLTRHGYYSHPVCGGIDRVFGLGLGRSELPRPDDSLEDHFAALCRYCGMFRMGYRLRGEHVAVDEASLVGQVSDSWRVAYDRFGESPPSLDSY
jgi:hypothetical protein